MESQLLRLVLSVMLGAVVGWERFMDRKPAGLRTHTLVCLGATGFVLVSERVLAAGGYSNLDPTRVVAAVITGIGFIGAGSIIRQGDEIRGITTAATTWIVAAIGVAVGVGDIVLALAITALTFGILRGFRILEEKFEDVREEPARPIRGEEK